MSSPSSSRISEMQSTEAALLLKDYNFTVMQFLMVLFIKSQEFSLLRLLLFSGVLHPILSSYCSL